MKENFKYFIRKRNRFLSPEEMREIGGIWRDGPQGLEYKFVRERTWKFSRAENLKQLLDRNPLTGNDPIIEIPECEAALFL